MAVKKYFSKKGSSKGAKTGKVIKATIPPPRPPATLPPPPPTRKPPKK
jgi:hypothetical protein